jgi:hypothetical protein
VAVGVVVIIVGVILLVELVGLAVVVTVVIPLTQVLLWLEL